MSIDAPAGPSNSSLQTWTHVTFGGVGTTGDVSAVHAREAPRATTHMVPTIRATDSTPARGNLDPDRLTVAHHIQIAQTLYNRVRSRQLLSWIGRCDCNNAHASRSRSRDA